MASSTSNNRESLAFEDIYDIVKRNDKTQYDLIYRTLLAKSEYLTLIPDNDNYSILHYLVMYGLLDLFNKVIAIPNIRFILLTKTATKPQKDILQIANENQTKSSTHKKLYDTIDRLVTMDKFVEYGKNNQINECRKMLQQDEDLANLKPPYRKYYLIHHLAFADNKNAFDQLRSMCNFDMKLLTNDKKTASEVAFEHNHTRFATYLESLSPEMRAIREQHDKEKDKRNQAKIKRDEQVEKEILTTGGNNMLDCFTCPLTKEIFHDPVVLSDGFTYERSAIQQWLDLGNRRSPMTNIELTNVTLVPNMVIKQALSELYEKQKK
ncbi:unnamed protein product [Rotaria sordida]|uniref:U-box domain-containing protein n=1 Tax=Rotaria sordida TaxID=392033 RepID=A0A814PS90_9BILA|nr:unnamed protein product [Rotaria sordida]CAF3528203.1 unnamed protein product [Rotaria sordida]